MLIYTCIDVFIFFYLFQYCSGEYYISQNVIPSYLNESFQGLSEKIFPNYIKMSMSLSKMTGTLLYSIDSNGNQLIVSLNNVGNPTLVIEFSKQTFYTSLSELCECERCTFENITLRIQMKEDMNLQCNNGKPENHKYEMSKKINEDYPVIKFNKTDKLDARLWLVNTPHFGDLYPNGAQLYGCIFGVWYNNELLKMDSLGVVDTCKIKCTPGICHSGSCLETYNSHPLCNCTSSFKNGQSCNDGIVSQNYKIARKLIFKAIKLSFTSTFSNLWQLNNEWLNLQLIANKSQLSFIIESTQTYNNKYTVVITDKYRSENQNILIIELGENFINLKFLTNGSSWIFLPIPYNVDFGRKVFHKLILQSKEGVIDMVYKSDLKELKWYGLGSLKDKVYPISDNNSEVPSSSYSTGLQKEKKVVQNSSSVSEGSVTEAYANYDILLHLNSLQTKVNLLFGVVILILLINILIIGLWFIRIRRLRRRPLKESSMCNYISAHVLCNEEGFEQVDSRDKDKLNAIQVNDIC